MDVAASIVKASLVPGSAAFLLYATAVGVLMLYLPGLRRLGRVWLTLLVVVYWLLALPVFAERLQRRGEEAPSRIVHALDARGATAIVVLGNGAVTYTDGPLFVPVLTRRSAYNVLEGARLYALLKEPVVIVSGGIVSPDTQRMSEADIMAAELQRLGVSASRIVREGRSVNTFEQTVNVTPLLSQHKEFIVVTTPTHMPRALALFQAQGRRAIPSPSPLGHEIADTQRWRRYVPSPHALHVSELVLYEQLASANARLRGWLHAADAPQ